MKFLLLGDDYKRLFVEDDKQLFSLRYDINLGKWVDGGMALFDNRYGFDSSEPEGSPYRWGNGSCMEEITEITKETISNEKKSYNDEKDYFPFAAHDNGGNDDGCMLE